MVQKLLAWIAFALTAVFAVLALVVVFARDTVGDNAMPIVFYGGLPVVGLAILVAIGVLVLAAFRS
ncbi:hypothetical protein EBR56_04270 [bacterium]|nr:hypothetical protein [bacterium]